MKKIIIIALLAAVLVGSLTYMGMYFKYQNRGVELTELINAQVHSNEAFHDKMWKILKQKAGVTDKYAKDFKEIYSGIMEGRYSHGGGQMMQWVKERNPNFDSSMYKDLMRSIEIERNGFFTEQKKLIAYHQEYNNLRRKIPSKWFMDGFDEIELKIVTSTKSKRAFESGKDDDVELF
jgi:hypothetical protein